MRTVLLLALFFSLWGCAGKQAPDTAPLSEGLAPQSAVEGRGGSSTGDGPFSGLVARQIAQAGKAEQAGDLRAALESWKVVAALRPENVEAQGRVSGLSLQLEREADKHFQRGLESLRAGASEAARREFLLSLVNNPDHVGAQDYLKNQVEPVSITYQSAAGETFESIAKKIYSDSGKAVIIARLNDLDPKGPLAPGTTLLLPSSLQVVGKGAEGSGGEPTYDGKEIDSAVSSPGVSEAAPAGSSEEKKTEAAKQSLIRAQGLYQARLYQECIVAAEKLSGHQTFGKKARDLVGICWFELGNRYLKEDRFQEAVDSYKKVDPTLRDVKGALAAVEARRRDKADEYYNEGVRLFINQRLEQAVAVWQKALVLNPAHPKAPRDIEKAQVLLEKLKKLK